MLNFLMLFAWALGSSVSLFSGWIFIFFSEGEASTQCTVLLHTSRDHCICYLWLEKLIIETQRVAFFSSLTSCETMGLIAIRAKKC